MKKPKKKAPRIEPTHYVGTTFRKLSDEKVAEIQVLWADWGWTQRRLGRKFRTSVGTISKVCRAIPAHLVTVSKKKLGRVA